MNLEITLEILDGHNTFSLFSDKMCAPSGANVNSEKTTLYQNIKFYDFNDAKEIYGVDTAQYQWYVVLGLRKSAAIPSPIYRKKNRASGYVFPVELVSMRIDGRPSDKSLDLLLSDVDIQSAVLVPRAGRITLKAHVLTVAERENYVLRTTYYQRKFDEALRRSEVVFTMSRETWNEPEQFTTKLADTLGDVLYTILKGTNITVNSILTRRAVERFNQCVQNKTLMGNPEQCLLDTASDEEKLRMERMMREIMEAEAELKGISLEEVERNAMRIGIRSDATDS